MYSIKQISNLCRLSKVGKLLPDALYVHNSAVKSLDPLLQSVIELSTALAFKNVVPTLYKISRTASTVSLLYYDDFDTDPHPALQESVCVNYESAKVKTLDFSKRSNRPILHRKETMVLPEYPFYKEFVSCTERELKAGYYTNLTKIGTEKGWAETIKQMEERNV